MAVKRIIAFVLMIITSLTLSGCIFPSGPYHYSHDSGFVFDFEEISYTYNDEVVFHIEFPMTTYAIDDHNGDDYYNFLIENGFTVTAAEEAITPEDVAETIKNEVATLSIEEQLKIASSLLKPVNLGI